MTDLTQDLYDRFQRLVYDRSDLHFSSRKRVFFERHLCERLREQGAPDFESYYRRLSEDPDELGRLIEALTTNQTSFFRNPAQFTALRDLVLPGLIEAKNRRVISSWGKPAPPPGIRRHPAMSIRIWSAGCSTGEEAYSVAFTLLDTLKYPRAWDVEVIGTDIKREALSAARRGVYDAASMKGIDPAAAEKYMATTGDGSWSVKEEAARFVRFFESNLKGVSGARPLRLALKHEDGLQAVLDADCYFDVIFCRNVMIYFDREAQQRLVDALFHCLRPGGYLFTGDSEPLHLFSHGFERVDAGDALYYRKPPDGE